MDTPMKKLIIITAFAVMITLVVACGGTPKLTSHNPNTVTLGAASFSITSISIKKGSTITFLNDPNTGALHILVMGQSGQEESENNAPDFGGAAGHRTEAGDSWTTPPWSTAGTYHVACTVHPVMNLTVIVTS